jgi:hypothetical protein
MQDFDQIADAERPILQQSQNAQARVVRKHAKH